MALPPRLAPLLAQYDQARVRLLNRMSGPTSDSGDGEDIQIPAMTDEEYLWEPVPGCWSLRRHSAGPGAGSLGLVGAGEWGRDGGRPRPWPPPFTTIAWRLSHLSEMLALRADHTNGNHRLGQDDFRSEGTAAGGITIFAAAADAWRAALLTTDDTALDTVGYSDYPDGSDPEDAFIDVVWWVNQELLHHGAEIALLRDLYRAH